MVEVYDITKWAKHPWLNTGGTRDKKYVQSPHGEYYYFKTSLHRVDKYYKYEFWNEIIAFWVGGMLGFNTLRYDVGLDGGAIGCISKSMIDNDIQDLIEGGKYLQAFDNSFDPAKKDTRKRYSFQLIEDTLINYKLESYINDILEVLVLDAVIGNGDRHQENWAFIVDLNSVMSMSIATIERLIKYKYDELPRFIRWMLQLYMDKKEKKIKKEYQKVQITLSRPREFSPIYDNGSSLARELTDDRVADMNASDTILKRYINNGKSEVHWDNEKVDHFSLLNNIASYKYSNEIEKIVKRVIRRYNSDNLWEILTKLDEKLCVNFERYKLPDARKSLIFKIIDLRIRKLGELDL